MKTTARFAVFALFLMLLAGAASAESMLEITDVIAKVDDDKQSADENGGTIKITPDSTLTLKVEVTNTYDSSIEGGDIEDIVVNALLEEVDDGDDLEEEASEFDLRPGRDKTVSLEFKIPLRLITDDTYKLVLTVDGEDENRTDHHDEVEFDIDVDKEKHELRFLRKEVSPSKVTCTKSTTLIVGVINTGEEDEDIEIIVDAPAINYNKRIEFELVEDIDDDDNEYEFSSTIDLSNVGVGTYTIPIKVLYYDGRRTLEDTLTIEVASCGTTAPAVTPKPEPEPEPEPEPTPPATTTTTTQQAQTAPTVEVVSQPQPSYIRPATTAVATPKTTYTQKSWLSENKWVVVILVADLILIIAGIIIITAVLKKRR